MSENDFDIKLDELVDRSVGKLLTADSFDPSAFDALKEYLWQKGEGLQHEYCVSKQILRTLRSTVSAITSRAEYLPSVRQHLKLAREFDGMLDSLIAGETRATRTPGVPRVI
ncbi:MULTISPECIES: hypothetical protein [Cupriavidus]|jgi:hypothetical protein|uniref:Uncharacterized protein n=1 Tax=Cupriavidus malaysiensis TaxID=367825 RepID=A0ABM6FGT5_9BURK|nr:MULTISPECIES: hypothetical protein [Cupriavidus]AOZ11166.1 hypothetical protein BKK80_35015 [Cupriavidus malaysiensis]